MWIVIAGNPVDGLQYHGPFQSSEEATHWANNEIEDDWWVTELSAPS